MQWQRQGDEAIQTAQQRAWDGAKRESGTRRRVLGREVEALGM